jgi:hypothetical protein
MNAFNLECNTPQVKERIMKKMQTCCARVVLGAAVVASAVAASGCASEPIPSATAAAAGLISGTTEVVIVFGRTVTNTLGIGTESPPPPPVAEKPAPSPVQ